MVACVHRSRRIVNTFASGTRKGQWSPVALPLTAARASTPLLVTTWKWKKITRNSHFRRASACMTLFPRPNTLNALEYTSLSTRWTTHLKRPRHVGRTKLPNRRIAPSLKATFATQVRFLKRRQKAPLSALESSPPVAYSKIRRRLPTAGTTALATPLTHVPSKLAWSYRKEKRRLDGEKRRTQGKESVTPVSLPHIGRHPLPIPQHAPQSTVDRHGHSPIHNLKHRYCLPLGKLDKWKRARQPSRLQSF